MQESGEMYLETILILTQRNVNVRSVDIADYMGVSKPAVSRAMNRLKEGNFAQADKNGTVTLTEKGRKIAEKVYERHNILSDFLMKIGVPEKTADSDACKMEHVISNETFNAIKKAVL